MSVVTFGNKYMKSLTAIPVPFVTVGSSVPLIHDRKPKGKEREAMRSW